MTPQTRQHGRTIGLGLFAVLLCSIAILWSWNGLMAELFGLPQMEWRHALALCLLALCLGTLIGLPLRLARRSPPE